MEKNDLSKSHSFINITHTGDYLLPNNTIQRDTETLFTFENADHRDHTNIHIREGPLCSRVIYHYVNFILELGIIKR